MRSETKDVCKGIDVPSKMTYTAKLSMNQSSSDGKDM